MKSLLSYQIRSIVLKMANQIKKTGLSFSESQKKAWQIYRFKQAIADGGEVIVRFYKEAKEIPEQRHATAVTSKNTTFKGTNRQSNPLQVIYFETTSNQVKSFNASRFDSFVVA